MGRISGIQSRRRRNNKQKRRLRLGLIAGSVLGLSALLLFGVWAIRAGGPSGSGLNVSSADILVESEKSMQEYDAPGMTTYTITATAIGYETAGTNPREIKYGVPGVVTPSSAVVTSGGTVTLKATPKAGFTFLGWQKLPASGTSNIISKSSVITLSDVNANADYRAVFYLSSIHLTYKKMIYRDDSSSDYYLSDNGGYIEYEQDYISYDASGKATLSFKSVPETGYARRTSQNWKLLITITDNNGNSKTITDYRTGDNISYIIPDNLPNDIGISNPRAVSVEVYSGYYDYDDSELVTVAIQSSGRGYVIAGDFTDGDIYGDILVNGSSYATAAPDGGGTAVFTVIMPSSDHNWIRDVIDADTGLGVVKDESDDWSGSGVYWSGSKVTHGDVRYFELAVYSEKHTNLIVRMNEDSVVHMGEIVTVARPSNGGITNGDMFTSDKTSAVLNTVLNATPNEGFMFDHWEYYDENWEFVTSDKQQLPVAMSGYHIFTAVFVEDKYKVSARSDPEAGGMISGTGQYKTHTDATVTAVPQSGYKFDKWTWSDEDGGSHEDTNETLVIRDIQADYDLTAHFKKSNPNITLSVNTLGTSPTNAQLYNYAKFVDGSVEYVTTGPSATPAGTVSGDLINGNSVTFQAFPNESEDYQFSYWVDQDGNTNSSNPYTVGDLKDDASYIAVFTKKQDQYAIEAIHEPDAAGTANITITGTTTAFTDKGYVPPHSGVTVTTTPAPGYLFEKWTWKTAEGLEHEEYNDTVTFTDIMQDYTLVAHYSKENPTIVLKANPVDKDGYGYNYATATYTKYPSGSGTATAQTSDTTGETTFTALGNESVTLQAFPNENNDYQFAYWIDKKGNTYQANPYVAGKITEDDEYTAIFTKKQDKYELIGVSDPKGGGSISFEIDNPDGSHDSFNEKGYVVPKANAVITATPSSTDYEFDRWTWKTVDGTEQRSTDNPLILNGILQDYTLTAHFILKQPKVTVKVDPLGEKDGKYNDVLISDNSGHSASTGSGGSVSVDVSGGDAITLQALPNENNDYQFSYWVDKDGNTSPSNPYVIGKISGDEEYTAVFTKKQDKYEVKIVSDPDVAGTFTGDGKYDIHSNVTVTATANAGYTFDKWTWKALDGEEHESHDATMTINDITEDHIFTAHFFKNTPKITVNVSPIGDKKGSYNYAEVSDTDGHMETTGSSGTVTLDVTGSSAVTLKAVPNKDADYKFIYWVDQDGNVNNSNPFAVGKISKDMTYTALFTSEEDHEIKVLASPPSGGKVSAKKNDSGGFNISAKANRGYKFKYWKCTDTEKTVTTETSFTVSKDEAAKGYTYIAYFEGTGEKTTSDLINEYFPNIRRLFAQPNYKYTRDYWISYVSNFVSGKKAENKPASGVPVEWNAYAAAETMMDEKAADSEEIVITAQSELITTENEIIPISTSSDTGNAEERAKEITDEKFGDHYTAEVVCVKNVSAPEGFDDGTRTYLWYNTGVQRDDNLFIIYEQDGAERIVSPVTDRHGTMTFTIDKLGAMNQFALVRVLVK